MIEAVCVCGRKIDVNDEHAGLSIKCPKCRRLVAVPAAARAGGETTAGTGPEAESERDLSRGLSADRGFEAPFGFGPGRDEAALLRAIEGLTATCRGVRRWLVAIFIAIVLLLLLSVFRR
jgi:hypothetical protein